MSLSRRLGHVLCVLLTAAGLSCALTAPAAASTAAGGVDPHASTYGNAGVNANDDDQGVWTDAAGFPEDSRGRRPEGFDLTPPPDPDRPDLRTAAAADWSLLGPPGGDVSDVATSTADANIVLAGIAPNGSVGGTLYRSTDGGATWSEVSAMHGISVYHIEFAPDGTAYIATQNSVWQSNDGGQSWVKDNLGLGNNIQVDTVAIDLSNPSTLWAGLAAKVMRSTDGGTTWTNLSPPVASPQFVARGIAIDPNDSNTAIVVFGGAFGGGQVFVTTDGGASWADRSAGLPGNPLNAVAYDGSRLLVGGGQLFGSEFVGLYQSTDLGVTWTPLHNDSWPALAVQAIAVDPSDSNTILVGTAGSGVNRTTDGGATWQISIGGTDGFNVRSVSFGSGNPDELFLGTDSNAVLHSTDGGDTFAESSNGISEISLFSIAANPRNPSEMAVAFQGQNSGGVYSTTDSGATWTLEPVPPTRYSDVGFAPDGTLYAISSGPSSVAPEGLYRRNADGSWTGLGPDQGPLFESDLNTMRFSRNNPDLILLSGADFGVAGTEGTIWRSTDAGQTWTKVYESASSLRRVLDIEIVENGTDQEIVASVHDQSGGGAGGVLRSQDGGTSWAASTIGLPGGFFSQPQLCESSNDPHVFYLAASLSFSSAGVYRSIDGGVTWEPTGGTTSASVADIGCDPADGRTVYMALNGAPQVVRSDDAGATFAPFSDGLNGVPRPRQIAFAGTSRVLMASTKGSFASELARDSITLTAAGHRQRGVNAVDLTWEGATSAEIDIYRDGGLIATVPNNGNHTDVTGLRGNGTYTYQVCRASSTICSNKVTVHFP